MRKELFMKNTKQILLIFMLAFIAAAFLTKINVEAKELDSGKKNGISWSYDSDGTLSVKGDGSIDDTWPKVSAAKYFNEPKLDKKEKVYSFPWSQYKKNVKAIRLEGKLTDLDGFFFDMLCDYKIYYYSDGRMIIIFPEIDTKVEKMYFGEGITVLPDLPEYFHNLKEVHLPDSLKEIGDFFVRSKIKKIVIPKNVEKMAGAAFEYSELSEIIFKTTKLKELNDAFRYCNKLKKVKLSDGLEKLDSTFWGCSALNDVVLPDTLKCIEGYTFYGCKALTYIKIPDLVTEIDTKTFYKCYNLKEVTLSKNLVKIGERAFENCKRLKKISLPSKLKTIGYGAFMGCFELQKINIPDSVTEIGERAFYKCNHLKKVSLSKNIKTLGIEAFSECRRLKKVIIQAGLKKIDDYAFSDCPKLESITIRSDNIKTIGGYAFSGINANARIKVPASVFDKYKEMISKDGKAPEGVTFKK